MSLEAQVAALVTSSDALTQQVLDLLTLIEQQTAPPPIDSAIINGLHVYYAAPSGTGDGASVSEPANLADLLAVLPPGQATQIRLLPGEHVLFPGTALEDNLFLHLVGHDYNPTNPPIICSTNTTGGKVSEETVASQTCLAHGYSEWPLEAVRCRLALQDIHIRGTDHALAADTSQIFMLGEVFLKNWVPSGSRESATLAALGSAINIDLNARVVFMTFHPNYGAIGDPLGFVSSMTLSGSTLHQDNGGIGWIEDIHNVRVPNTSAWKGAMNINRQSKIFIPRYKFRNVSMLARITNRSEGTMMRVEALSGSAVLFNIADIIASKFKIGNGSENWPAYLAVEGYGFTILANSDVAIDTRCQFNSIGPGSADFALVRASRLIISGADIVTWAVATQGWKNIVVAQSTSQVYVENSWLATFNSATSTFMVVQSLSKTHGTGNTITVNNEYALASGGQYVDNSGVVH